MDNVIYSSVSCRSILRSQGSALLKSWCTPCIALAKSNDFDQLPELKCSIKANRAGAQAQDAGNRAGQQAQRAGESTSTWHQAIQSQCNATMEYIIYENVTSVWAVEGIVERCVLQPCQLVYCIVGS